MIDDVKVGSLFHLAPLEAFPSHPWAGRLDLLAFFYAAT
jgi:hypothetical protein